MSKFCSFCGKSKTEVERLIDGPGVGICNECIELMHEMLATPPKSPSELKAELARYRAAKLAEAADLSRESATKRNEAKK